MRTRLATIAGVAALVIPAFARADVQACLAASERGQHARAAGKLREARDQFNVCGADACPAMVRRDCVQWQQEIVSILPSVVFGARDAKGRDLFDVTVSMDGEVVTRKLDGKGVLVDPGPHTFKFEIPGTPPAIEKALIKEGERARNITVSFNTGNDAGGGTTTEPTPPIAPPKPPPEQPSEVREHSVFPWILVGVGGAGIVAGVVIVATTPDRPSNCNKDTATCARRTGESDADLKADQDRAGKADTQPVIGYGVVAGGAALVIAGLVWHFVEPTGPKTSGSDVRVTPWTSPRSAGLTLDARF
jgi:hypothetical protein